MFDSDGSGLDHFERIDIDLLKIACLSVLGRGRYGPQGDDLAVNVLGFFLDGFIEGKEGHLAVQELFDAAAEVWPVISGDVEIASEIEEGALLHFFADPFRFDEPESEISLA